MFCFKLIDNIGHKREKIYIRMFTILFIIKYEPSDFEHDRSSFGVISIEFQPSSLCLISMISLLTI